MLDQSIGRVFNHKTGDEKSLLVPTSQCSHRFEPGAENTLCTSIIFNALWLLFGALFRFLSHHFLVWEGNDSLQQKKGLRLGVVSTVENFWIVFVLWCNGYNSGDDGWLYGNLNFMIRRPLLNLWPLIRSSFSDNETEVGFFLLLLNPTRVLTLLPLPCLQLVSWALGITPGGLWYAWAMASPKITHYKILHCVSLFVLKLRNLFIISFYFFIKSVYTTIFIKKKDRKFGQLRCVFSTSVEK